MMVLAKPSFGKDNARELLDLEGVLEIQVRYFLPFAQWAQNGKIVQ